jgi:hypothetical protein
LGITVTDQNVIQEEIKKRLNSDNACYHSLQKLPSFGLLLKNLKLELCIFAGGLFGCEAYSLILRGDIDRVLEN